MIDYDDSDRNILLYYNITTLNPVTKTQLNLLDQPFIDDEEITQLSKEEQYDLLTKLVQSSTDARNKYDHDSEILEDPLEGSGSNVAEQLVKRGIIQSMNDESLNQYLISSQQFNSKQYLTTVHKDTSINELTQSLKFLEQNIHSQTEQLKSVMDDNFISFLNCKKSIDDILTEFKQQKTIAQAERDNSKVFNPQRHRNMAKQESLISGLEESIKNLNMASTLRIRPVVENKNIESKVSRFLEFVKKNSFFFDLPKRLLEYASEQDHDKLIETYQTYLEEKNNLLSYHNQKYKREISKPAQERDHQLISSLEQEQRMINTSLSKIFEEVDQVTTKYKQRTYEELLSIDYEMDNSKRPSEDANFSKFLSLLQKLDQLDQINNGNSNHVYDFLDLQLSNLLQDFDYQLTRFENKFALVQTKLRDYINSLHSQRKNGSEIRFIREKYNDMEEYFMAAVTSSIPSAEEKERIIMEIFDTSDNMDLSIINETWLVLNNFISYLSEIYLKNLNKFINNYSYYNDSKKNNTIIDTDGSLRIKFFSLVEKFINILIEIFSDDSGEVNQLESSPANYTLFLPYHTNSLSAIAYLGKINLNLNKFLSMVGSFVGSIGNLSKSQETNKMIKNLRSCSSKINQKIIEAVCSVWVNDCSQFYDLETWEIYNIDVIGHGDSSKQSTFTKAMKIIESYQIYMINKMSTLVFQKVPLDENDVRIVSSYPNKRILVSLEIQFMRSLNILNESVMKRYNVERNNSDFNDEFELYKILTMNNFDQLSRRCFPLLIHVFDREFDKKLSEQNLKIFKDIDKVNETVFQDILIIEKLWINNVVSNFFVKVPVTRPSERMKIDGFIYETLMHFVKLIHVVKPLTSLEIFIEILNELQEAFLRDFLTDLRGLNSVSTEWFTIFKLDINFFLEIFESSRYLKLNEKSLNMVNLILQEITNNENPRYTEEEFENILLQNLKDSENQFDSFL